MGARRSCTQNENGGYRWKNAIRLGLWMGWEVRRYGEVQGQGEGGREVMDMNTGGGRDAEDKKIRWRG